MRIAVSGIDETIKRLEAYKKNMPDKQHKFLEKLAAIGIDVASVEFKTAQYDGTNDVVVKPVPEWDGENRLYIAANGHAVTFIEFGTGVVWAEEHEKAAELGMVRGAFGQGKGSDPDGWTYYGEAGSFGQLVRQSDEGNVYRTYGNPPARAMYLASKEMRTRIAELAREVFYGD